MHKLLLVVLLTGGHLVGMAQAQEIMPVPPIVYLFAQQGAQRLGLTKLPLLYVTTINFPGTYAATIYQNQAINSERTQSIIDAVKKQYGEETVQSNHMIIFFRQFFSESYEVRKAVVFHELVHILQFNAITREPETIHPLIYQRGIEQEADLEAANVLSCRVCVEGLELLEIPTCLNFLPSDYATKKEILLVAQKISQDQLCPYHQLLMNKTLYRILQNQTLSNVASLACCCLGLAGTVKGQGKLEKMLYLTSGLTAGISIDAIFSNGLLKNWLGRDIEEQIACGELEP